MNLINFKNIVNDTMMVVENNRKRYIKNTDYVLSEPVKIECGTYNVSGGYCVSYCTFDKYMRSIKAEYIESSNAIIEVVDSRCVFMVLCFKKEDLNTVMLVSGEDAPESYDSGVPYANSNRFVFAVNTEKDIENGAWKVKSLGVRYDSLEDEVFMVVKAPDVSYQNMVLDIVGNIFDVRTMSDKIMRYGDFKKGSLVPFSINKKTGIAYVISEIEIIDSIVNNIDGGDANSYDFIKLYAGGASVDSN